MQAPRNSSEFLALGDASMTYLLPPAGRNYLYETDLICKQEPADQTIQNYTQAYPMLQARSNSTIALRYQENGHISLPLPPGKLDAGTIYLYGTLTSMPSDQVLSIHRKWNAAGTGGDRRGLLMAERSFDDLECYQTPQENRTVYNSRHILFPPDPGQGQNRWCRITFEMPEYMGETQLGAGQILSVYWVWDWSSNSTVQIYTTCLDVQLV
ncbi:hypothetical protein MMC25_007332 [Agyrium rufum]|nr:hypothetical protein [Agyrium rufum]